MSGDGVAADSAGRLYFSPETATFDASSGGSDYGDTFVKMSTDRHSPRLLHAYNCRRLSTPAIIDLGSGGVDAAARSARRPPTRDGRARARTARSTSSIATTWATSTRRTDNQIVQSLVEHLDQRTGRRTAGQLQRARLLQRQRLLQPARGHGPGVPADERAAVDDADLAVGGDVRRDYQHVQLSRRNPGDLGQRQHERDPLGSAEQRRHCSRRPPRLRPDQPRERATTTATRPARETHSIPG